MKSVTTENNFWLSGYYDDFASSRAVADDLNVANARVLDHTKTHFGSAVGGFARLNPRFKYSYPDRAFTSFMDGEPLYSHNPLLSATETKLAYNGGISEWLTIDNKRNDAGGYNSKANLQHPISMSGNRQKYNGAAGDSYLQFTNGHETGSNYFCPLGDMDFSYGASPISRPDTLDINPATDVRHKHSGSPIGYYQQGETVTSGETSWAVPEKSMNTISFASVYVAEQQPNTIGLIPPHEMTHEITSPSLMPFLIHQTYIARGVGHPTPTTTSGTERLITYDGALRFKGIGESFHIRLLSHMISDFTLTNYTLKIGYKDTATYNKSTDAFSDTASLMTVPFTLTDIGLVSNLKKYEYGVPAPHPQIDNWVDIEVVPDFSANTWKAYANGSTTHFASGSITGGIEKTTALGWSLDLNWAHSTDDYVAVTTMIDRVAVALPLTNIFDGTTSALPPVSKMNINYGSNSMGDASITILDDSNNYTLAPLTAGVASSEWKLLIFNNGEDRPIWTGIIENVSHKQNGYSKTLETTIKARDSFSVLDRTLPVWEVGQNAYFSLNDHISMSAVVEKNLNESTSLSNSLFFGVGAMSSKGTSLGLNIHDTDVRSAGYSPISDGRASLFSGSAIQIYNNEDATGANNAEAEWEGMNTINASTGNSLSNILNIINEAGVRQIIVAWDDYDTAPSASIATYKGLAVGDNITIKGTAYDGTYPIVVFKRHRLYDRTTGDGRPEWQISIEITDATSTDGQDELFKIKKIELINDTYDGDLNLYELTTYATHNCQIGDTFLPAINHTNSPNNQSNWMGSQPMTVSQLISTTEIRVITRERYMSGTSYNAPSSTYAGHVIDYTKLNGGSARRYPKVLPVLREGNASNPFTSLTYRNIHARWIRDLPNSIWFKAQFGIIKPAPHWVGGTGSITQHPFNTAQAALITGWPNVDGQSDSSKLSTTLTTTSTTMVVDEPALWWHITQNTLDEFIIDLVDNDTAEHQYIIGNTVTAPSNNSILQFDNSTGRFYKASHGFAIGQIIVHTNFDYKGLNGVHMVMEITGTDYYETKKVENFVSTRNAFSFLQAKYQEGSGWNDGSSRHNKDPDAISHSLIDGTAGITGIGAVNGKVYWGGVTLGGIKGIKRDWTQANTIYSLRDVDESNGYKHCFALWADMRNDGNADADGGYRKNDFGLTLPTTSNYSLGLTFADQMDAKGNPDVFTELKLGEDADLWSLDSEAEPYSGNAWCSLDGASNDEPLDTRYHDWDEKGGAVCLIDTSRFWNLNTMACGGRSGYLSGGLGDLGDWETASFGFPYMIDNYWKEACASYKNTDTDVSNHENSLYFVNDGTPMANLTLSIGATRLYVNDNTQFDTAGYGTIICEGGSNRANEKTTYYFRWSGKGSIVTGGVPFDYLDNVYVTSLTIVTDPENVVTQLKALSSAYSQGSKVRIESNEFRATVGKIEGAFDKVTVYNTAAALYGMRLILNLEGYILSPNQGTFFADDKIRFLQNLATTDTWSKNSSLPCISDFNNVPLMSSNGGDDYGSMFDARNNSMLTILSGMAEKDGVGLGGGMKTLSWLMGRDNRMEFREAYSSGHALDRNNLVVSDLSTQNAGKITNVRVYYNGNSSFADHPTPQGSDIRWKIIQEPLIFNSNEALAIAKQEYLRETTTRISIKAEVLPDANNSNRMTGSGRYGYVADVCRKNYHDDPHSLSWWSNSLGGSPFAGMMNALDSTGTSINSGTDEGYFAIMNDTTFSQATKLHPRKLLQPAGGTDPLIKSGEMKLVGNSAAFSYDGNTNYGANVTVSETVAGWHTLTSTVGGKDYKLSVYCDGTTNSNDTTSLNFGLSDRRSGESSYYWYGANSLSHAVQIVHVDNNCNKVSSASNEHLRMAISVTSGSNYGNATFTLHLIDSSFERTITGAGASSTPPVLTATIAGTSSVVIDGNGLFSIPVPSSYDSNTPNIIVSANIDYLRGLIRYRCDSPTNSRSTLVTGVSINASGSDSIFPLGMRQYNEFGHSEESRSVFYAPRLHIVNDLTYIPATTLTYTDDYVDLNNELMVIKQIRWSQDSRNVEKVILSLEKVSSHYGYSFANVFANSDARKPPAPAAPPPTPPLPDGGGTTTGGRDGGNPLPRPVLPPMTIEGFDNTGYKGMTVNDISRNLAMNIKGRGSLAADKDSSNANWGILGSANTGVASSFDRAIDGIDSIPSSSEGSAIATNDGFALAGINDPEIGVQGESHSHTINVRVPNDTSTGVIGVQGTLSLDAISGGGDGEITTTIECVETGESISITSLIAEGSSRLNSNLIPTTFLNGANVVNNTLKITVERKPAQGNDAAGYQTIVIHNLSVNIRRFNKPTIAQSDSFRPY